MDNVNDYLKEAEAYIHLSDESNLELGLYYAAVAQVYAMMALAAVARDQ